MTGVVDIKTGKIIGVKKNTLAWFHEKGHLVYNQSDKGIRNSFRQESCATFLLASVVLSLFVSSAKYLALLFLFFYSGYAFYEELWCWRYAKDNFKKFKEH